MLLAGESSVSKVTRDSVKEMKFYKVEQKVDLATDLIDLRDGIKEIEGYRKEEMSTLLNHICVSEGNMFIVILHCSGPESRPQILYPTIAVLE